MMAAHEIAGTLWRDPGNNEIYILALVAHDGTRRPGKRERWAAICILTGNRWREIRGDPDKP